MVKLGRPKSPLIIKVRNKIYRDTFKLKHPDAQAKYWKTFIDKHPNHNSEHWAKRRAKDPNALHLSNKRMKANRKQSGSISIKTIQLVYEDNIKKHGTLTCYLCLEPIAFGNDSLEHKTPLCRGGSNEYSNLAVACMKCNRIKNKKTEAEFKGSL